MVDQLQGDGAKGEGEISNNVEEDLRKLNETNTKLIQEATSSSSPNSLRPCYSNENLNENQGRTKLNQEEDINQDLSQGENEVAISTEAIESQKEKDKEVPGCLIDFRDKVEACSHRLQKWSDEQELKARQKQSRRREKRDGGVRVDEEGKIVEPSGDNFFERKGIIPLVAVILSWVNIVFLWRICSDSIRKEERATASRGEGIGFLVGFIILWLLTIWSYIKVVITGPGYVRDHLPIAEQPPSPKDDAFNDLQEPSTDLQLSASTDSADPEENQENTNLRTEEEQIVPYPKTINEIHEESVDPTIAATLGPVGVGMVAQADEAEKVKSDLANGSDEQRRTDQADQLSRPKSKAIPDPDAWAGPSVNPNNVVPFAAENQNLTTFPEPKRLPQKSQPLHPSNTFCYRCRRYKPPRSHHCRHCGTCVLKMDHHCPWVGGCVGARNHKFFYNFLQWVTALEYYVLVINSILFNRGIRRRSIAGDNWTIDGYMISLFPICALFILFTTALLITHTYLFIVNLSTIEHMGVDRQKVREDVLIETWVKERARVEGRPKPSWFDQVRERNKLKAKWSSYWGKPKTEANLFWIDGRFRPIIVGQEDQIGNLSKIRITERSDSQNIPSLSWYHAIGPNWRQAMGDNVFGWFLPISRSKNANGLAYEANWRFGSQGEWTARKDWSKRLIAVQAAN